MKLHSTNYTNTFIETAEDCPAKAGQFPPVKVGPSIASLQFDMVYKHPYTYSSDDVLFHVYATRNDIPESEWKAKRDEFFSKGQPCFRASPLTKRYGWGVHSNQEGKIAVYGTETEEYQQFLADDSIRKVKAMRSKKHG